MSPSVTRGKALRRKKKKVPDYRLPPAADSLTVAVRAMNPPRYTVRDAAAIVGKSVDTLTRWRRSERCIPSDSIERGSTVVPLYTEDDLEVLRAIASTLTAGRKPKDFDPDAEKDHRHARTS